MKATGNIKSNAIYNPNEMRNPPPPALADPENDSELESYIRSKYQYKRFMDKASLVALKLGPSRSTSGFTSRSISTPVVKKPSTPPLPSSTSVPAPRYNAGESSTSKQQAQHPPSIASSLPTRSVSQPVPPAQPRQSQSQNGVWADLVSLQGPTANSSLPLQYQVTAAGQLVTPASAMGSGFQMTGSTFSQPLQPASLNMSTTYQPFSQSPQTPAFASPGMYVPSTPLGTVPTGFVATNAAVVSPQFQQQQQQYYQPQPLSTSPALMMPQTMLPQNTAQYMTPSPVFMSTPSPVVGTMITPSPQFGVPSPAGGYMQPQTPMMMGNASGLGVMMTPQMQMSAPVQTGMGMTLVPSMQAQAQFGVAGGATYQTQPGFGTTGQWGPL
ncbi:hypothetical protein AX17_001622 [Amanita inopinata Kibby_2008]|nr:hypothetical protein AX17_001622 [Amanita inopinata Kibby_2008]